MIYLSYILANWAILRARRRGFPHTRGAFSLGRWAMVVNVAAIVWGGSMLVNFFWPRAATNPKPNETGGLLSFGIGFVDKIPIQWSVLGAVLIVGGVYYAFASARIPSPVITEGAAAEAS
jgi:hypothetical protein